MTGPEYKNEEPASQKEYEAWEGQKKGSYVVANAYQIGGSHYGPGAAIQHWDWAVANNLGYLEGVLTKYVCRHKTSGKPNDLEKALHYAEKLFETHYRDITIDVRGPIKLQEELISAYALTETEAEICRLAARYRTRVDLERLGTLVEELLRNPGLTKMLNSSI